MKRKDIYLFAIVVLAQGIWICVGLLFDQTSSDLLILLPLSAGSFVCALAVAARRASARAWRTAGPVIAGLFLLPSLLVDISPFLEMAYLGAPSVALILAAALLKPGLDLREEGLPGSAGMLLGLIRAREGNAAKVVQGWQKTGLPLIDGLALLLRAKHQARLTDEELSDLGLLARGGGGLDMGLRAQAAWAYVKQSGQAAAALDAAISSR